MKKKLFDLSYQAMQNAYAPYSKFNVGAALITSSSKAFIGSNIENAAFGSTICAERVCISAAYSHGVRKDDIIGFAIITESNTPSMPCGACLQVLSELLNHDTTIYVFNTKGDCIETNVSTLLPYPFAFESISNV